MALHTYEFAEVVLIRKRTAQTSAAALLRHGTQRPEAGRRVGPVGHQHRRVRDPGPLLGARLSAGRTPITAKDPLRVRLPAVLALALELQALHAARILLGQAASPLATSDLPQTTQPGGLVTSGWRCGRRIWHVKRGRTGHTSVTTWRASSWPRSSLAGATLYRRSPRRTGGAGAPRDSRYKTICFRRRGPRIIGRSLALVGSASYSTFVGLTAPDGAVTLAEDPGFWVCLQTYSPTSLRSRCGSTPRQAPHHLRASRPQAHRLHRPAPCRCRSANRPEAGGARRSGNHCQVSPRHPGRRETGHGQAGRASRGRQHWHRSGTSPDTEAPAFSGSPETLLISGAYDPLTACRSPASSSAHTCHPGNIPRRPPSARRS